MNIYKKAIISVIIHILSSGIAIGYENQLALILMVLSAPFAYLYSMQGFRVAVMDENPNVKIFLVSLPIMTIIILIIALISVYL